jgi:hypothetical protein
MKAFFDLSRDVDEGCARWGVEPQLLSIAFQAVSPRMADLYNTLLKKKESALSAQPCRQRRH